MGQTARDVTQREDVLLVLPKFGVPFIVVVDLGDLAIHLVLVIFTPLVNFILLP